MSQPVYFTVTADYQAFIEDSSTADSDYNPQSVPVGGTVTFTPLVNTGDVVRALDASPRPVGYISAPVVAIIDPADGRLKLRTSPDSGGTGTFAPVRLLASGEYLELDGPLFYQVSFTNVSYANGRRGTIAGFTFEAPATDTEVNLIEVGRAAGQIATNLIRPTITIGDTITGAAGSSASVENLGTETASVLRFTVPRGATTTLGTVTTGNPGSSAAVTNTGTNGDAVLNFTLPRGSVTSVGTTTTGDPGTNASVTNTGTNGDVTLNFTIPRGAQGIQGIQGIPGSATINGVDATTLGRLVCTTALGSSASAETTANTWAKIATYSSATQLSEMQSVLAIATSSSAAHDTAVISVFVRFNATGANLSSDVRMLAKGGTGTAIAADSFKIISGAWGSTHELWMRKGVNAGQFRVYELGRSTNSVSVTYNDNAAWQSTEPVGAVNNVSTNGVTAFGAPVLTTTNTATVTNKDLTSATNTFPSSLVTLTGSQSLSNKTLTSPTISGTPTAPMLLSGTRGTDYEAIGAMERPAIGSISTIGTSPALVIPSLTNELAYATRRGATVTVTKNGSAATLVTPEGMFDPRSTSAYISGGVTTNDVVVIEVDHTSVATFSGAVFYGVDCRSGQSARDVTIEVWNVNTSAWETVGSVTGNATGLFGKYLSAGGTARSKVRYTFTNFATTAFYVYHLFVASPANGYASGLLPRGGGELYGTNAAPPTLTAAGSDTNIDLSLSGKGTGGVRIPTIKDTNGNNALLVTAGTNTVNYLRIASNVSGQPAKLSAYGGDTDIGVNIESKGAGTVQANGVPVVTTSGAQTLTSKRINPRSTTAASASSLTPDISAADFYAYTALAAALTIEAPTGTPVAGQRLMFRLKDNGTARALTWNAIFRAIGVTIPTTTVANKVTYVSCIYNNSETVWDVIDVKTQA